ncbi:MAG: Rrf2 family transcriptional regulator [Candidatus Saganbacteria bacterium]|nr:Rrf2 family transcriptional regulator [Candidatus Saganbacteria bacterium]
MKLSTKGRYGVRLMLDLALHFGQGPALLKDISKRQEISEKYLWQLIPPLKNAGLVNSIRGSKGGYILAKKPAKINLEEIVSLLEGPINFVDCVDDPDSCKRALQCVTMDVWDGMAQNIKKYLSGITLQDLIEKNQLKSKGTNYFI